MAINLEQACEKLEKDFKENLRKFKQHYEKNIKETDYYPETFDEFWEWEEQFAAFCNYLEKREGVV